MQKLTHYVNGAHIDGTSGRFSDVFNPATGEVQAQCPLASKDEVDAIIAKAEAAQPAWAATNPQRRARVMMKFVDLLNRDMDKLAEALSREHGKTIIYRRRWPWYRHVFDAPSVGGYCGYYAV